MTESDPEMAEMVLDHIYSTAMINAGITDDAVAIANKSNTLLEKMLERL